MVEELLKESIQQNLHGLKHTPSGWLKRNCPMCTHRGENHDTRERFGILLTSGSVAMHCFNCGFTSSWQVGRTLSKSMVNFLGVIGTPQQDIDRLKFEAFREKHNIEPKREAKLKGSIVKKWKEIEFLTDCYPIATWLENGCEDSDFLQAVNYVLDRNLIDTDKLYWTPTRESLYNKRIIVPYYYKEKIVGWTGRLTNKLANKSVPKYYNQMPPSFIYGIDQQQDYNKKYVIINEGVFDAIVTDGIGVLHNEINDDQAAVINTIPAQKILCPDRDKSGEALIEVAIKNKWLVAFPHWGRDKNGDIIKDASQAAENFGYVATIQSIITTAEKDRFAINTKRKLDRMTYGY